MVLDGVELVYYLHNIVLRQDSCNCLIAGISFHHVIKGTLELWEDRGG